MFKKGEYVVYGSKGVCLIQDVAHVDMPGADKDRLYYIMSPLQSQNQGGVVYLPTDSNKAVIRKIMTKEEANLLLKEIPDIEHLEVRDEKKREESYKEALRSCSGRAWVSVIKTLNERKASRIEAGKKVTALDERYLRAAEHELYGELSVVLDVPREEIKEFIDNSIGVCEE